MALLKRDVLSVLDGLLNFLARVGIVRVEEGGAARWPFRVEPWWVWKAQWWPASGEREPFFALFRNELGVIKWVPGRLLPRRWGVKFLGLEVGDRGGCPPLYLRRRTRSGKLRTVRIEET